MTTSRLALLAVVLSPAVALAHAGGAHTHTFIEGLVHPLTGADHLLAALCLGLAAGVAARARATLALFGVALVAGLAFGASTGGSAWELGLGASVLAAGLVAARGVSGSARLLGGLAAAVGLLHGQAHGAELPALAGLGYASALVLSSLGVAAAASVLGARLPSASRIAAALVAGGYAAVALLA